MRYILYTCLLTFCLLHQVSATTSDSIVNVYKSQLLIETVDTNKLKLLINLGVKYQQIDKDTSIQYLENAVLLASTIGDNYQLARAYHGMAVCYSIHQNLKKGNLYARKAAKLYHNEGKIKNELRILKTIGLNHWKTSNYDSALVVYNNLLHITDSINFESFKVPLYNNIGLIYEDISKPDKALEIYTKGLVLARKYKDQKGIALLCNNMSIILRHRGEFVQSNKLTLESIKVAKATGFNQQWARGTSNLGANYTAMGDYENAVITLKEAIKLQEKFQFSSIKTYWHLGEVYDLMGDYDLALEMTKTSEQLARKNNVIEDILYAHKQYFDIYKHWNKSQLAYQYVDSITYWKDSIARMNLNEIIVESEQKYKNKSLQSDLAKTKTKVEILEIKEKQNRLFFIIGLLILAGIISIGYYFLKKIQFRALIDKEKKISEQMIQEVEDYKQSVANNLHDDLGQNLAILKNLMKDNASTLEINYLNDTIDKLRNLSRKMYPSVLEIYGLDKAVDEMINRLNKLEKTYFSFDLRHLESLLDNKQQILVYRIIQEAFSNVLKHADAQSANASYNEFDKVLTIQDNGLGIPNKYEEGIGLKSIKVKARILNAKFNIHKMDQKGTSIQIEFESKYQ